MKVVLQRWHVPIQKATILTNAVTADRRAAFRHPLLDKGQGLRFGFSGTDAAVTDPLSQARATVWASLLPTR